MKGCAAYGAPPDEVDRFMDRFERNDRLIRQGQCPNGCGLMTVMGTAERLQTCGACGFMTNVPADQVTQQ